MSTLEERQKIWYRELAHAWVYKKSIASALEAFCCSIDESVGDQIIQFMEGVRGAPRRAWHIHLYAGRYLSVLLPKTNKRIYDALPATGNYKLNPEKVAAFMEKVGEDTAKGHLQSDWAKQTKRMETEMDTILQGQSQHDRNVASRASTRWMGVK